MKFVVGLLSGVVIGAVGAVVYAGQSGKDLREAYQSVRSDLSQRDLDQLGARVEGAVAQLQKNLDAQIADVKARVDSATAGKGDALELDDAVDAAADVAADAADNAAEAATEMAAPAVEAATEAVETVQDAAGSQGA